MLGRRALFVGSAPAVGSAEVARPTVVGLGAAVGRPFVVDDREVAACRPAFAAGPTGDVAPADLRVDGGCDAVRVVVCEGADGVGVTRAPDAVDTVRGPGPRAACSSRVLAHTVPAAASSTAHAATTQMTTAWARNRCRILRRLAGTVGRGRGPAIRVGGAAPLLGTISDGRSNGGRAGSDD